MSKVADEVNEVNEEVATQPVSEADQLLAHQLIAGTLHAIAFAGQSHETSGIGVALGVGGVAQGLLIAMIAFGADGTTGDKAIQLLTEQFKANKTKAEIAAAQIQRRAFGAGGGTLH